MSSVDIATVRADLRRLLRRGDLSPASVLALPDLAALGATAGVQGHGAEAAVRVADALVRVIENLPECEVGRTLFGLASSTKGERLGARRLTASRLAGVTPDSFRVRREPRLLDDIARELLVELATTPRSGEARPLDDLAAEIPSDWAVAGDWERALHESRRILDEVTSGRLDPLHSLDRLELAAAPQFDAPGGDPDLVIRALAASSGALRMKEASSRPEERLALQCRPAVLRARAYLRIPGAELRALEWAYATLTFLENYVGGTENLHAALTDPERNAAAEHAVATLAVFAPAVRRAPLAPQTRETITTWLRDLVATYLAGQTATYPRTWALASQWFYLLVLRGNAEDRELVDRLYALDRATRPDDARAQATRAVRDLAYARYCGDRASVEWHEREAHETLRGMSLHRHMSVLDELAYLAPAADSQ